VLDYNKHDVKATELFLTESLNAIDVRKYLTDKQGVNQMNFNDTKIGKDFFIRTLTSAGVECWDRSSGSRKPRQTPRPQLALRDCIFDSITFKEPEFNRVLNYLKSQTITETKGVFKDLIATVKGFDFVFGLGGIHGSKNNKVFIADDDYIIEDWDVVSYYPSLAISHNLYPEHLGSKFCDIYKQLKKTRISHKRGTPENAMYKLALNGTYGDSNSKYSVFYDPKFTMSITLNGQLLLCKLAEYLMIYDCELMQVNTDGLTVRYHKKLKPLIHELCKTWENETGLELDIGEYSRMFIRDVNNYIAGYINGDVKCKGAYEYNVDWSKNHSALIVPRVATQILLNGGNIKQVLNSYLSLIPYAFMLRTKVPRSSRLEWGGEKVQNISRYYVSYNGKELVKIMPPLPVNVKEGITGERCFAIDKGWVVAISNHTNILDVDNVNLDYYVNEVEKLVMGLV